MFFGDLFASMCPLNTADLQRIFKQLDKNGDDQVSLEELNWLLERIEVCLSLEELESFVGKSSLDLNEFLFFWKSISKQNKSNKVDDHDHHGIKGEMEVEEEINGDDSQISDLVEAFNVFDMNGDGFISCEELQIVLSRLGLLDEKSGKDCKRMICRYDTNLDGLLDFEEFKNMMLHSNS